MPKKKNHYIDNKKFYADIVEYKNRCREAEANGKPKPEIPLSCSKAIIDIATNVCKHPRFFNYSYKDEMISDAIFDCIKGFEVFDETRFKNPHAFFTQCCWNANRQRIKNERKQQYVKYKSFETDVILSSNANLIEFDSPLEQKSMYDNIAEYIENYERSEKERKIKRATKAREKREQSKLETYMETDDENTSDPEAEE